MRLLLLGLLLPGELQQCTDKTRRCTSALHQCIVKLNCTGACGHFVPADSDYLSLSRYLGFSVLDNRHLSDIWVICQKCQFGVRKGWKALFLQLKPQALQTSRLCHNENLTFWILFKYFSYVKSAMLVCILWSEHVPEENWMIEFDVMASFQRLQQENGKI